jgi:hypothetical protein
LNHAQIPIRIHARLTVVSITNVNDRMLLLEKFGISFVFVFDTLQLKKKFPLVMIMILAQSTTNAMEMENVLENPAASMVIVNYHPHKY